MTARRLRPTPSAIVMLLATLGVPAAAREEPRTPLPAPVATRVEQAVTTFMARFNAPGVSVAIGLDGHLVWEDGYGLADMEHLVPAKASTVYRLASVSKPITAVAVMQLVEQRRLSLDDTVGKWLPGLPTALQPITVEQLLSHQSGIRHYTAEEDDSTKHYPRHYASLRDALAIFKDDPLVHAPGTQMTYSTYAYTLLGVIMEEASGQAYVDFVKRNVFERARMVHSRADDVSAIVPNRSAGYAKAEGDALRKAAFMDPSYKIPGGGWLSTAGDIARFGLALEAGTLVQPETFKQMTTMQRVAGKDTFYGLGWILEGLGTPNAPRVPGLVWHGGVQQGVTTCVYMLPREHSVVAIMTNLEGEGLALAQLASEITDIALGRLPPPGPTRSPPAPARVRPFAPPWPRPGAPGAGCGR